MDRLQHEPSKHNITICINEKINDIRQKVSINEYMEQHSKNIFIKTTQEHLIKDRKKKS